MTAERHPEAIPFSSGYTLDLYCCECQPGKWNGANPKETYFWDGPKSYSIVRKQARKAGWILHKDGYATCPECNKKEK